MSTVRRRDQAARRAQRHRERRRDGVIAVLPFELLETDILVLVRHGFLTPQEAYSITDLDNAVSMAFEAWLNNA